MLCWSCWAADDALLAQLVERAIAATGKVRPVFLVAINAVRRRADVVDEKFNLEVLRAIDGLDLRSVFMSEAHDSQPAALPSGLRTLKIIS